MKRIVFVCTGNTCRSPMARVLFEKHLKDNKIQDIEVDSCGIFAVEGSSASENAVLVAEQLGVDLKEHKSKPLNKELAKNTDLFVCMTENHANVLKRLVPKSKITVLNGGIPDPYGQDEDEYMKCAQSIMDGFRQIFSLLEKQ